MALRESSCKQFRNGSGHLDMSCQPMLQYMTYSHRILSAEQVHSVISCVKPNSCGRSRRSANGDGHAKAARCTASWRDPGRRAISCAGSPHTADIAAGESRSRIRPDRRVRNDILLRHHAFRDGGMEARAEEKPCRARFLPAAIGGR